ncbi:hypothetical protein ES703_97726 [subsurface metagenome]
MYKYFAAALAGSGAFVIGTYAMGKLLSKAA